MKNEPLALLAAERAWEADSNGLKARSASQCIEEPRVEQAL